MKFCIESELAQQPDAAAILYCDGAGSEAFRPELDLELSHWFPTQTPECFAADTSTEICLDYAASGEAKASYSHVVNNHVDVDGILSVFSVLEPELALAHRDTLVGAAQMGDFGGWSERPGQRLFQSLSLAIAAQLQADADAGAIYRAGFELVRNVLKGRVPPEVESGLASLATCVERIEQGDIGRTPYHERFVHYALPKALTDSNLATALGVCGLDVPLSDRFTLLPHARARFDRERIALQSVECAEGWYYDLYYPGYAWAVTPDSWRPPGLLPQGSSNLHRFDWSPLQKAVDELAQDETATGRWTLSEALTPFSALSGRGYPVVLAFMDQGRAAPSRIPPEEVAQQLAGCFSGT